MATSKGKAKRVITVESKEEFENIVAQAKHKHVLVEFFATWCNPCMNIGPYLEKMAHEYEDSLVVLKVDVNDQSDLAEEYEIDSLPAFLIIKNKVTLETFIGSDEEKVLSTLQKFCGKPEDRSTKSKSEKQKK